MDIHKADLQPKDHYNLDADNRDCKESPNGEHKFIPCDEWEPTCIYCGKFQY